MYVNTPNLYYFLFIYLFFGPCRTSYMLKLRVLFKSWVVNKQLIDMYTLSSL